MAEEDTIQIYLESAGRQPPQAGLNLARGEVRLAKDEQG